MEKVNYFSAEGSNSEATLGATIVRVEIREGKHGTFYAYSDDIRGLVIAEASYEAVLREIPRTLTALYEACGQKIIVVPAQRDNIIEWVKIPAHVAQAELDCARA